MINIIGNFDSIMIITLRNNTRLRIAEHNSKQCLCVPFLTSVLRPRIPEALPMVKEGGTVGNRTVRAKVVSRRRFGLEIGSTMAVGEKRIKNIDDSFQNASIVLVDIEGTTTSISFVKVTHLNCGLDKEPAKGGFVAIQCLRMKC
jgi:hypothetical protein